MMSSHNPPLIRISRLDNVLVAVRPLEPGTLLEVDGATIPLEVRVGLGHKIASRDISAGEKIIKYGVPIGSATTAIRAGETVHLHNMKSDYLPTHSRGRGTCETHAQH